MDRNALSTQQIIVKHSEMEVVGFLESISQVVMKLSDSTSVSHIINITFAMVHVPDDNTIFVRTSKGLEFSLQLLQLAVER